MNNVFVPYKPLWNTRRSFVAVTLRNNSFQKTWYRQGHKIRELICDKTQKAKTTQEKKRSLLSITITLSRSTNWNCNIIWVFKAFNMFIKTSENQCNTLHLTTKYSGTDLHYFFCNKPALHCMSSTDHAFPRHFGKIFCSTVARPFFYHNFTCCVKIRHSSSKPILWRSRISYPISTHLPVIGRTKYSSSTTQVRFASNVSIH